MLIVIVLLILAILFISAFSWQQGGLYRYLALQAFLLLAATLVSTSIAVSIFSMWQQWPLSPTPLMAYALFTQLPTNSIAYSHWLICFWGSYTVVFIAFFSKWFLNHQNHNGVLGNAHFATPFEIHQAGFYSEQGIILGKHLGKPLRSQGHEGVLVVAPTGSGKTTAIAIPNLLEWPGSGIFNDLKGELYRLTKDHREQVLGNYCYCFAPANPQKNTHGYNPFFYVSDNPELRIRDIQLIAEMLIPATRIGVEFWYQSSRELFLTLALYLFETKGAATLAEIHDLSKQMSFEAWLAAEIEQHDFSITLKQNAYAILNADEKTQQNILKDFHSKIGLFSDPIIRHATSSNDFDLRELRSQKISIYLNIPDADKERLSPILTLFCAQFIQVMTTHEPTKQEPHSVLALMDEFGNLARIAKLKDGMSFLRAYHVRPIIIVQYLSQLTSIYGRDDAKGFLNAKVKIAFTLNDLDDAKFISQCLGNKTVKVTAKSQHHSQQSSTTHNISFQSRPLMTADEIMKMKPNHEIILLEAHPPIKAIKHYWYREKKYNAS